MVRLNALIGAVAVAAMALALSGCGGGGSQLSEDPGTVGVSTLEGTVYAPDAGTALFTAQMDDTGQAVPDCPVVVVTEEGRRQLASGRTDGQGQYRFRGLPSDVIVIVEARVPGIGELLSRVRLEEGGSRADIDEATTLVAWCVRFARGSDDEQEADDDPDGIDGDELADDVADGVRRFQQQAGRPFGTDGPGRPDFADAGQVREAARALLGATAGRALGEARQSRSAEDAERAVRLVMAYLRARHDGETQWTQETIRRIIGALREGSVTLDHVAEVLSRVLEREVTPEQVRHALRYLWNRLKINDTGQKPEVIEVVAALTVAQGNAADLRLETTEQIQELVDALLVIE
jgi:hypothetical protein